MPSLNPLNWFRKKEEPAPPPVAEVVPPSVPEIDPVEEWLLRRIATLEAALKDSDALSLKGKLAARLYECHECLKVVREKGGKLG